MPSKLFLRIDRGTIAAADLAAMTSAPQVMSIDAPDDCFQFHFEPIVLDHALLLFGQNESRFGFDLSYYLHSAQGFFGRIADGFVVMPNGSPDFKRRFSEDLGVAIGSLFLAHSIGLRLETVAQIPTNARLDKHSKVPDFVGFDSTNQKRVYECKGTTSPDDVDKHRQKAKQQLADHNEANVSKFALVTYVPTTSKLIPPFIFVSDPPIPLPRVTEAVAAGLHLMLVLKFSGIDSLLEPLRQMLSTWVKHEQASDNGEEITWNMARDLRAEKEVFQSALMNSVEQSQTIEIEGRRFAGTERAVVDQGQQLRAFTGVDADHVVALGNALRQSGPKGGFTFPRYEAASGVIETQEGSYSRLSDGSLLYIYPAT